MRKTDVWKPGNMLYPLPVVMVSVADKKGRSNIITVAWAGTICSDPAMLSISVRKERFSHQMLMESREFVVNLTTEKILKATDYCGVRSGKDVDKWKEMRLTPGKASKVNAPIIEESPVNLECRVTEVKQLGSHDMFIAKIVAVNVDEAYMNKSGRFDLNNTGLVAYSHGQYRALGKELGTFGYSVKKRNSRRNKK